MREGMLQLQLLVPSLDTDATFTANMKREDELEMELKSDIKFMTALSEQKFKVKYGNNVPFRFSGFPYVLCDSSVVERKKTTQRPLSEFFRNI